MYVSFDKVQYIYPRTSNIVSVTTNISQGGKGEFQPFLKKIPKKMLEEAKTAAVKASKAMKTKFAGVDIMFDKRNKRPIVLEVNVFPGFPASRKFNLSKRLLEDIIKNSH